VLARVSPWVIIIALVTLTAAAAAVALRNLVHCALSLAVCFAGLAAFYVLLGAEFVGLAQILVYVGAVAILIVFSILLTRGGEAGDQTFGHTQLWLGGAVAALVLLVLCWGVLTTDTLPAAGSAVAATNVKRIGEELMHRYVLPLQALGVLLTAALSGALILAMNDKRRESDSP
jgi:NADH-quinone oxidoreductase subunit J